VLFHGPTVSQERNDHDLLKDFADEVPGYLNNAAICDQLALLDIEKGVEKIGENLRKCYRALIRRNLIREEELQLLEAWLADVDSILTASTHQEHFF
jgi:hypothetical protein